jgi:hypothetical protein
LRTDLLFETFGSQGLAALPGAGDFVMLIVDGDGGRIGFDGEFGADVTRRQAVAVAIE